MKTSQWQDEIRKISQQRPLSALFISDRKVEKGVFQVAHSGTAISNKLPQIISLASHFQARAPIRSK